MAKKQVVKFVRIHPGAKIPAYQHPGDSGADACACQACRIAPGKWLAVPTGLVAEIPPGCEIQVRPRSGLAAKHGVTVLNAPGTVDSGYRGEIKVILINHGSKTFKIAAGDRIAQLVVARVGQARIVEAKNGRLSKTRRGAGGFGSTGR